MKRGAMCSAGYGRRRPVHGLVEMGPPDNHGSLRPQGCRCSPPGLLYFLCELFYVLPCAALSSVKLTPMSVPSPAALSSGLPAVRTPLVVLIPAAAADGK